jgi:hypothetical protein
MAGEFDDTCAHREERRRQMLALLRSIDQAWVQAFQESGFSDIYFSRLFTELWLRGDTAITKTDAYVLVKGVGVQTAIKYVRRAVEEGYLEEVDNPADGRSRLLRMTPRLKVRFTQVIDQMDVSFALILGTREPPVLSIK